MTIKLIKTDSEFIETAGAKVDGIYFYLPYWYKKVGDGLYEQLQFENLPDELKERIRENRELIVQ